jgi:hypothetical protein
MASSPPGRDQEEHVIIERALRRLYGSRREDAHLKQNAAELVGYLVKTGIRDEDEIVELARIAHGKRYDPDNGSFL